MAAVSGNKPHVLAVPLPAQGHVKPLMSLCRQIAKHGIKVTFVNAQTIHDKIVSPAKASVEEDDDSEDNIVMAAVPDGLTPEDDPNSPYTLMETLPKTMPQTLTDLIEKINICNPSEKISCVIADLSFGWVFEIGEKMGAEAVGFSPPSFASFAVNVRVLNLIQQGNLDTNACELHPNFLPIGPLHLLEAKTAKSCSDSSNFYSEDASCLIWLNNKPPGSVVYVSFGSLAVYSQIQLDELALRLELSGRAFLWVVRQDLANGLRAAFPDGFLERVAEFGKIVEWAPQNKVLSHPAMACFMSHCGWNSTLEVVSKGGPYLCWPYFAEQAHDQSYVCDKWDIGLRIDCDENGLSSRYEIKKKIDMVLSDSKFKENVFKLKEACAKSVREGGSSYKNLETFIDHLKCRI